jgi:hypothetical protein
VLCFALGVLVCVEGIGGGDRWREGMTSVS